MGRRAVVLIAGAVSLLMAACGGGGNAGSTGSTGGGTITPVIVTYVLTVNSTNPASGTAITVTPVDNSSLGNGTTGFTRTYNTGTIVTLTAPTTSGGNPFSSWSGCTTSSSVTCTVTMGANATVTANYSAAGVNAVTVTPNPAIATIGTSVPLTATVTGTGTVSQAVTWSVTAPLGSTLSAGTISSTGVYTTPYPAPATVTVKATSTQDTTKSGSVTVTLVAPVVAAGPALSVDAGNPTHAIDPDIYGMNAYGLDTTVAKAAHISIARWGGDSVSRYNYQTNVSNAAGDWFFENISGAGNLWPTGKFNDLVTNASSVGVKTLGTVPVLGWVSNGDSTGASCSYPESTYPNQFATPSQLSENSGSAFDTGRGCGWGVYPDGVSGCTSSNGCNITGDNTAITSIAEPSPAPPAASAVNTKWADSTWSGGWVNYLVNTQKYGPGNPNGPTGTLGTGVAIYDLDNEPSWWDAVHRDVHPLPFTYDEVTNGGIGTALAIKTVDPTAEVSGPVMDYWWDYFYSKKDVEAGWNTGPCNSPWSNPADRTAHGGVPFIEYYLQQFAAAQKTYGVRLLDYLSIHAYYAANYQGNSVAFTTAGDTGEQQARLDSTRAFWDPTYTDGGNQQPNYTTDANYTSSCNPPAQATQLIPMLKQWVAKDYPGTKTAIDEYNWGGQEHINGAIAQADILGIFGREGLNIGALWGIPDPKTQVPGLMAFEIYRNYDGANSAFGDMALASTSANQSTLAVYGALRTADSKETIIVLNKTYGNLTTTLSLANFTASGQAQVFLFSNANLAGIVAQPALTVTPPATGSTTSSIANYTFPAQSITLFVIPKK